MAKTLQFRRGTTGELELITGAPGELFVDTTKDIVVVSDGVTAGGFPLQSELVSGTNIKTINGDSILGSGDIEIAGGNYGNANVAAYLPTYTGNLVSLTGLTSTGVVNFDSSEATVSVPGTVSWNKNADTIDVSNAGDGGGVLPELNTLLGSLTAGNSIVLDLDDGFGTTQTVTVTFVSFATNVLTIQETNTTGVAQAVTSFTTDLPGASIVSLGPVGNVKITGGSSGQVLTTDGTGNVSWQAGGGGSGDASWGNITGTLSNQTDLQTALNDKQDDLVSGTNIKTINGDSILGSGDLTVSADFSEIAEDVLPAFSEVYDIGSADKRWYDGYYSNKVDIDGAEIRGSVDGVVIDSALLVDQLLVSDNIITPDDSSVRQYFGEKGVVVINGNLDVDGEYLGTPVVETTSVPGVPGGAIDTTFTAGGNSGQSFDGQVEVIKIQADGNILVGGTFENYSGLNQNYFTALSTDGELVPTIANNILNNGGANNNVLAIAIQEDNKILVGGAFTTFNGASRGRITRLTTSGLNDSGFSTGSGFNSTVHAIDVQSDGKILVGGSFSSYDSTGANALVRLNTDGSQDNSYSTLFPGSSLVQALAIQSDGKILAGGDFSSYDGSSRSRLVRINSNGSLDSSFDIGSGFNNYVYAIAIQEDNKILVGGAFTTFDGDTQNRLVRLNSDGSLDSSFDTGVGFGDGGDVTVVDITVQSDGKILVVGDFGTYNGTTARSIVRLEADGTIDSTWITEGFSFSGEGRSANSIGIRENGNIIVGGRFNEYDGTDSSYIVEIIGGSDEMPGPAIPTGGADGFIRYNADISAFQAYNGSSWELLERVTTPPTTLTKDNSGYVDIDFTGAMLGTFTKTDGAAGFAFTGSNYLAGSRVTIRVIENSGDTVPVGLNFPTGWVFVGTKPEELAAGKTALLTVTSFGTTEADCVATWSAQA